MSEENLLNEFIKAIKKKPYLDAKCSICGYQMKWLYQGDQLIFDSGCWCMRDYPTLNMRKDTHLKMYLDPKNGHLSNVKKFISETLGG